LVWWLREETIQIQNSALPHEIAEVAEHFFRHEAGKMVATLTRLFGIEYLTLAEDVVQAARCSTRWRTAGKLNSRWQKRSFPRALEWWTSSACSGWRWSRPIPENEGYSLIRENSKSR